MDEYIFPIIGAESKLPVYTVGVGWNINQHPIDRKSGFPHFQIIYCTGGLGVLRIGEVQYSVGNGQCFFLYPDEPHEYYPVNEPWETHWITFDGVELKLLVQSLGFMKSAMLYLRDLISLDDMWRQLLLEAKSNHKERGFRCSALNYSLLVFLKDIASQEPPVKKDEKLTILYQVLAYIDKNFDRDIEMTALTACVDISPQYLCRLFKKYLNMRPFEYVMKRRIQEAKNLLIENKLPEGEIAVRCGFNSFSYFCAIFKRQEKITPTEFRMLHRI